MSKTVFDTLLGNVNADAIARPSQEVSERWDNFKFWASPWMLEESELNPLLLAGRLVMHVEDDGGSGAYVAELAAIAEVPEKYFYDDAILDGLTQNEIHLALGRVFLAAAASWRNQVRSELFINHSDARENVLTAVDDFAQRWGDSQMDVALQLAGHRRSRGQVRRVLVEVD